MTKQKKQCPAKRKATEKDGLDYIEFFCIMRSGHMGPHKDCKGCKWENIDD